jgi:hypothetical protein
MKMKKYFISFVYLKKDNTWGFSNCFKNSLGNINNSQIEKWNEEFEIGKEEFKKVTILFFKEIK